MSDERVLVSTNTPLYHRVLVSQSTSLSDGALETIQQHHYSHVLGRGAELPLRLDDLVDGLQEVLLADALAPGADGKHARFRAHRPQLRTSGAGAQARQQLIADVLVDGHGLGVDLQDLNAPGKVGQAKLRQEKEGGW